MAVAFQSVATTDLTGGGSSNLPVNMPSGVQEGDLLIAHITIDSSATLTAPGGWNLLDNETDSNLDHRAATYWRLAPASPPASYTWVSSTSTSNGVGTIARFTGHNPAAPINANDLTPINSLSANFVAASITTTVDNCLLLGVFAADVGASTTTITVPGSMTERWNRNHATSFVIGAGATEALGAAGATGTRTATINVNDRGSAGLIAIAPEIAPANLAPGSAASTAVAGGPTLTLADPGEIAPGSAVSTAAAGGPTLQNAAFAPGSAVSSPVAGGPTLQTTAETIAPGSAVSSPVAGGPTLVEVLVLAPGSAVSSPTAGGPTLTGTPAPPAPPADYDIIRPPVPATLAARWATGQHLGAARPHMVVEVQRGRWNRDYRLVTHQVPADIPGETREQPWMAKWDAAEDWLELPGVLEFKDQQSFDQNGVTVGTIAVDNVRFAEMTGTGGIFHIFERGYLSPLRGYNPEGRTPQEQTENEWFDRLARMSRVRVWQGYGEPERELDGSMPEDGGANGVWVFAGQLDDIDLDTDPDTVTITVRNGQSLTDQRIFGWNKSQQLRDPIVFSDRYEADTITEVGTAPAASSSATGYPASNVLDGDRNTEWRSANHTTSGNTEWVEIMLPEGGRYQDFILDPAYDGMEVYVGFYASHAHTVNGVEIPSAGWVGDIPVPGTHGAGWTALRVIPKVSGASRVRDLGAVIEAPENSTLRIGFRNLPEEGDGEFRAGVTRLQGRRRETSQAAIEARWILVDDVSDVVRVVLRWAGFSEWNVESAGTPLKGKWVFNRESFLVDPITKAAEAVGFSFFLARPATGDGLAIPVFKMNGARENMGTVFEVTGDDLLTEVSYKNTMEPLAYIIRVRGKNAAASDGGTTLGGGQDGSRIMGVYRPPWSYRLEGDPGPDRLGGLIKHVTQTMPELKTVEECLTACKLIALNEALASLQIIIEVPGYPVELDEQVGVVDEITAINSRIWVAQRTSEFRTGINTLWKISLTGPLLDTPDLQAVIEELASDEISASSGTGGSSPAPPPETPPPPPAEGATVNALGMPDVPGAPTLGAPPAGATVILAGVGDLASAINNLDDGETLLLGGGTHTLASEATLDGSNKIVRAVSGEVPRITGNKQLRIYGSNNTLYEVFLDTRNVPGKHLDLQGINHKIWRNKFDTGHTGSPGGYGTCLHAGAASYASIEGNWFRNIGQTDDTNIFDHAIYAEGLDRSNIRYNLFTNVLGGYCFHGYDGSSGPSATNCIFEYNRMWNSYGVISSRGASNNIVRHNAFQWDQATARKAPTASAYHPAGMLTVTHNAIYTAATNWGTDGIEEHSQITESDNLEASPQFQNPASGDLRITNTTVSTFLGYT